MRLQRTIPMMALAAVAWPAMAQTPAPPKPADAYRVLAAPPCAAPDFPAWGRHRGGPAPIPLGTAPTAELMLGDTADLTLAPVASVALAVPLVKPAQPGDRAGLVTFRAATAGTYRIALGGRAWIDVIRDGQPVPSVAHHMGTACSGIAKMVDFRLDPGSYTIQLSAVADPSVRIAIARLP